MSHEHNRHAIRAIQPWAVQKPRLRVNGMLRHGGQWSPLSEYLPHPATGNVVDQILVDRASVDYRLPAGEWEFHDRMYPSGELNPFYVYWKAHEHYFESHGARSADYPAPVWYGEMRVTDLMYGVMNDIARTQGYRNFDHYHTWFMENVMAAEPHRGVPAGSKEVWPVILSTFADEGLQDGNHRFHQYVELGLETIPVLAYATELQTIKKIARDWQQG